MLVVGFGNTAADVACELAGKAEKVYLSHRHGSIVVSKAKSPAECDSIFPGSLQWALAPPMGR